ncbi:DUF2062 domain-containing protein [Sphingomonas sp.]|uniref:DUF2062 domain-containing protein n=1 Tax=Sphingomonas sp. TaxID=28214 RepID=UPI00286D7333|nr:DUF2062 domain-containing protein [Sphingomonas sp.]
MADLAVRLSRWFHRVAPSREEVLKSRWLKPFGKRIRRRGLWRFTRRSVPRGVAIGLFIGIVLMIPGLQIVGAALVSAPLRGNIPLAAAMTFLSNPATTPLFIVAAINVGNRLGYHADLAAFDALRTTNASVGRWLSWLVSDAAPAMLTGLAVIGAVVAFAGYWVSLVGWRWWVARKWRHRRRSA